VSKLDPTVFALPRHAIDMSPSYKI
jgi:hypothetical protein